MLPAFPFWYRRLSISTVLGATLALTLAGCGISTTGLPPVNAVSRVIQGRVHGGTYPIQSATVRLMETQSNGYGGAAKALLPPVVTDVNGYFTFPNTSFTCDTGQFAYLTVSSGTTANLGSATLNNNVIQLSVIGSCATLTADFSAINVLLTEVSTVATAAALGNFISIDNTNALSGQQIVNISAPAANNAASPSCSGGSSMSCTAAGLAHGFTNAYNLVDAVAFNGSFPTGQARLATPTNTNSYVPAQLLNTIGNILQNCVDSVGGGVAGDGSFCGQLFTSATPPGIGSVAPTNTLQVALNMIKNPVNNTAGLFNLQTRTPYFTPDLATAPTSFAISIFYGAEASNSYVPYPIDLALDAADNVYILYGQTGNSSTTSGTGTANTFGALLGIGPDGTQLFDGQQNTALLYPTQLAVNSSGRVFVTNNDTHTLLNGGIYATAVGSTNGALSQIATLSSPSGIAVDRSDNLWVSEASTTGYSILEYSKSAVTSATSTLLAGTALLSGVLGVPVNSIAIDTSQDVWGVSTGSSAASTSYAVLLPNKGSALAPVYDMSGTGGIKGSLGNYGGFGVALNAVSTAYFPTFDQLDSASFGTKLTTNGSGTATAAASGAPQRVAVDGAGNVFWADAESSGLLYEFTPATASGSTLSLGTLTSLLPCYPYPSGSGSACVTITNNSPVFTPTNLRSMAIDSAGDVWYVAQAGVGTVVETLGLAAPTWPQLSFGHSGCTPGLTTTVPSCP